MDMRLVKPIEELAQSTDMSSKSRGEEKDGLLEMKKKIARGETKREEESSKNKLVNNFSITCWI